jgi:hypothetical protein
MNSMKAIIIYISLLFHACYQVGKARDSGRCQLLSSVGLPMPLGGFGKAYQKSLAYLMGTNFGF